MSKYDELNDDGGLREDVSLLVGVGVAVACLSAGVWFALAYDDPHWMNRAGAGVVAVQLVAARIEFSRRRRLGVLADRMNGALDEDERQLLASEVARSESQAFAVVVSLAAIGELLHGFGDLLFEAVFR